MTTSQRTHNLPLLFLAAVLGYFCVVVPSCLYGNTPAQQTTPAPTEGRSTVQDKNAGKADQKSRTDVKEDKVLKNTYAAKILFPLNVAPDIVSNTCIYLLNPLFSHLRGERISNIWPIVIFLAPVMGPSGGVLDAWHGYPFWDPVALDEHRKYD